MIELEDKKKYILKIITIVMMYLLFNPIELYFSNLSDFPFSFYDFILIFIILDIVISIIIILAIGFVHDCTKLEILDNVLFGFMVNNYFQYLFINSLKAIKFYTIINTSIWIIIFILCNFIPNKVKKAITYILLGIITITLTTIVIQNKDNFESQSKNYYFTGQDQFTLSDQNNIIVLILDEVPNQTFDEVYKRNPSLLDHLNDFTYYNNCNSGYDATYLAINKLLTQQSFQADEKIKDWFDRIWQNQNTIDFYNTLHKNNYKVNFYKSNNTTEFDINQMSDKFDNIDKITNDKIKINKYYMTKLLMKLSVNRMGCDFIVQEQNDVTDELYYLIEYNNQVILKNYEYYDKIKQGIKIDKEKKYFVVQWLQGLHNEENGDYMSTDRNCNKGKTRDKEEALLGCFVLVNEYIKQLKKANIYDQSTIIIASDHGEHHGAEMGQPIWFMKTPNESHDKTQITNKPIDFNDFIPTVLNLIGENYSNYGKSFFDIKENEQRERILNIRENTSGYNRAKKYNTNVLCEDRCFTEIKYIGNRNTIYDLYKNNKVIRKQLIEGMW